VNTVWLPWLPTVSSLFKTNFNTCLVYFLGGMPGDVCHVTMVYCGDGRFYACHMYIVTRYGTFFFDDDSPSPQHLLLTAARLTHCCYLHAVHCLIHLPVFSYHRQAHRAAETLHFVYPLA